VKVRPARPAELSADQRATWDAILDADPSLASPYLCHEFVAAVGRVRDDVFVGVMEEGGRTLGFFPYQRGRGGVAGPVAGRLSDCQALIAPAEIEFRPDDLLRDCGLRIWDFDHLLASQTWFAPHHRAVSPSPTVDLSGGFERYREERRRAGSGRLDQFLRKSRKLAREKGELRFEMEAAEPAALERVFAWKSQQCRRTGVVDFFAWPWTRALVTALHAERGARFAGMLSTLHAGDRLVAAHFGMRSRRVLHWWFPVYDEAFGRYSPGGVLLVKLAESAAGAGLATIDLGKGEDAYKGSFANGAVALAEGSVRLPSLVSAWRSLAETTASAVRRSPVFGELRRLRRRWRGGGAPRERAGG
jgi:CelD/BcsL family acetyltransferase involved in cellulose biosynthesis